MSVRDFSNRAPAFSCAIAIAVCAAAVLTSGFAFAQSAVCRQLESELASVSRANAPQPGRSARAERAQLASVQGSIASLGCDRGSFIFGPQPPAQCGGLKSQAAGLSGRIAQIEAPRQAASGGDSRRRLQLMAALDSYNCRAPARPQIAAAPAPRERSFFDVLFGRNQPDQPRYSTYPSGEGNLPPLVDGLPVDPSAKKFVGGGPLAICVRTCDGFFFPVNYEGTGAKDQYEEVCQADRKSVV